jgi:integrase
MPRRATERLTDKLVRGLPLPQKGAVITYDADVAGFGARITAAGARAFVLNYMCVGRERRLTIGQFPIWSATAAREEARLLRRKVDAGVDPMDERDAKATAADAARSAPTMNDLFARYEAEHLPRKSPRAASDDRSMWIKIVLPRLGKMKVGEVRPTDIDALHAEISKTRPVRANRLIEVVRKAFNMAVRWGWRTDNPASGVHRNHEEKRARYLSGEEIIRLSEALAAHPERASANAIRLLLLTGARRNEVLTAQWDMFNLDTGVWAKPSSHTKQRKMHRVPLSTAARQLLVGMRADAAAPYVFPGRSGGPLTDIKRTWAAVCGNAGISGCRVHDLRHTYASILAGAGMSLPIIGALLGHTQAQTTSRYAHLLDDPLRVATERVGNVVSPASPPLRVATDTGSAHRDAND